MAEQILDTKSRSKVEGLPTLVATNGLFSLNTTFDNSSINIGNEEIEFLDPSTQELKLLEQRELRNGLEGIECELLINQDVDIIYDVDVTGQLFITDKNFSQYTINGNSELNFNFKE